MVVPYFILHPASFILLLAAAGCISQPASTLESTPPALFQRAEQAYLEGDLASAREAFRQFTEAAPGDPFRPWAFYWLGRLDLKAEKYTRALWNFRRSLDLRPEPVLRAQVLMGIGDVEYNRRNFQEALRWYRRIEHEGLGTSVRADELCFKIGVSHLRLGNQQDADRQFVQLEQYAGSAYLEEARRRRSAGALAAASSYVLVDAFAHFAPADTLASELRRQGMDAAIERVKSPAGDRFEVRIPLLSGDQAEARETVYALEAKGFRPRLVP